ncbi:MAG: hypothetical protein Q8R83_09240 [Legionellaceae bacterium]|nr:hypothetical protein [Legionellaceae bacterium]
MDDANNEEIEQQAKRKQERMNNAKIHTNCFASAALAISNLHGRLDSGVAMDKLLNSSEKINKGNISEIEEMLMTQAKTLDYLFYDAINKLVHLDMINQIEVFTTIAFRAQAQCRKTLATLAEIKHPKRTTFIHKQNNAIQVNHAVKSSPEKNKISSEVANELLAVKNEQRLDTRAATSPVTNDSTMETVAIRWGEDN